MDDYKVKDLDNEFKVNDQIRFSNKYYDPDTDRK